MTNQHDAYKPTPFYRDGAYMSYLAIMVLITLVVSAWVLASDMAYRDALAQDELYTGNVCSGVWPDYRMLKPDCPGTAEQLASAGGRGNEF